MQPFEPHPALRSAAAGIRAITVALAIPPFLWAYDGFTLYGHYRDVDFFRAFLPAIILSIPSTLLLFIVQPLRRGSAAALVVGWITVAVTTLGVGGITALCILATVGDWRRLQFEHVAALIGLGLMGIAAVCLSAALIDCNIRLWQAAGVRRGGTVEIGHGFPVEPASSVLPLENAKVDRGV